MIKKIFFTLLVSIFISQNVFAITLSEALLQAYKNNPELNAERENTKISKEELKISKSNYLPSITILGTKSQENTKKLTNQAGVDQSTNDVNPLTQKVTIEQTLIDFGRRAELKKNQIGIDIANVKLLKKEQDILLKAIEAFSGLILANEKFKINQSNLGLLERQVETDRARLERGQITLADLAQSEASFSGAQAKFIQSKNDIITNKLNYENIIGPVSSPDLLKKKI
jgi:outer membrane protein